VLDSSGRYSRPEPGAEGVNAQQNLLKHYADRAFD
jgi:hypothetical protein